MKTVRQKYLDFELPSSPTKVVAAYRKKYGALNALLLANPAVLELVHSAFCQWLSISEKGRCSGYTLEEILRCLVVMFVEQDSYREVAVRIENSDFLRSFVGLGFAKPMLDFSFVGKAFAALSAEILHAVNQSLAWLAKRKAWIRGEDFPGGNSHRPSHPLRQAARHADRRQRILCECRTTQRTRKENHDRIHLQERSADQERRRARARRGVQGRPGLPRRRRRDDIRVKTRLQAESVSF
jgi:hypothetical protein